ncbi:hypothetical protein D3C71_1862930 [compost metagenome]
MRDHFRAFKSLGDQLAERAGGAVRGPAGGRLRNGQHPKRLIAGAGNTLHGVGIGKVERGNVDTRTFDIHSNRTDGEGLAVVHGYLFPSLAAIERIEKWRDRPLTSAW